VGDDLVNGLEVLHPRQLGLRDLHRILLLDAGEDLDRPQGIGVVPLLEIAGVLDFVGVALQNVGDDLAKFCLVQVWVCDCLWSSRTEAGGAAAPPRRPY
jgi:hypothetical protein